MQLARRVAKILVPPTLVAAAFTAALRFDPTLRLLVMLFDSHRPAEAAAPAAVSRLTGTFDGPDAARPRIEVALEPVITGVVQPTDLAPIPGMPGRWVVLSKRGTAYLAREDGSAPEPWFELDVATASELGLLGIAFHPRFTENGLFYVDSNPKRIFGDATHVSRWRTDPRTLASPRQEKLLLEIAQPYPNHNGGQLRFGPDGMLYIGMGDGGYRGDPHDNAQNLGTLLGALLRIDVDRGDPYEVPRDNPFIDTPGARPEIWAYGLRNPWRFSFDPAGRLVVADVGQDKLEEVDLAAAGDNLGWRIREGDACYEPSDCGALAAERRLVDPIWTYGRDAGISIAGGVSWTAAGPLEGRWLAGDFGTGRLWALSLPEARRRLGEDEVAALGRFPLSPTAFARAPDGTVWVTDFQRGAVFRIVPAAP